MSFHWLAKEIGANEHLQRVKEIEWDRAEASTAGEHQLDRYLNSKDYETRTAVMKNPRLNSDHLTKALDDPQLEIRMRAVQHPSAQLHHLGKALDDPDRNVSFAAQRKASPMVSNMLDDGHSMDDVRKALGRRTEIGDVFLKSVWPLHR